MSRKVMWSLALVAGLACTIAGGEARADRYYYGPAPVIVNPGYYQSYYGPVVVQPVAQPVVVQQVYQPVYPAVVQPVYYPRPYYRRPVEVRVDDNFYRSQYDPRYVQRWKYDDGRWKVKYKKYD